MLIYSGINVAFSEVEQKIVPDRWPYDIQGEKADIDLPLHYGEGNDVHLFQVCSYFSLSPLKQVIKFQPCFWYN